MELFLDKKPKLYLATESMFSYYVVIVRLWISLILAGLGVCSLLKVWSYRLLIKVLPPSFKAFHVLHRDYGCS